jgi:NhaC family Na+:H+ antiporter
MAIPFFMLAGELMESGGISRRLFDFAHALVGFVSGGLAMVAVVAAMFFAGIMEGSGMLKKITDAILKRVRGRGNLVAATILTSILTNILAAEQYLSIVITGRMYREAYRNAGLHHKNLSRVLEDGGTLTSPLVPWNTCGAFMATTLGVSTLTYLPFVFMNMITPVISLLYGYTGLTIKELDEHQADPSVIDHSA